MNGFMAIETELQKRRTQSDSVRGKDCPFRVEFRYKHGTRHYQYFETYEAATHAEDSSCRYSPFGSAIIERPSSQQIQARGKRDGWSKYRNPNN